MAERPAPPRQHLAATPADGRPPLRADAVVRLAVDIADREGLAAVSFRRLAADLGVTPMSLYRHVRDKDDLLDRMTDAIMAELVLAIDRADDWPDQLREVLRALHRVAAAHPVCGQLVAGRPLLSLHADRAAEAILTIMERAGFGLEAAIAVVRQVTTLSLGPALAQSTWTPRGDREAARRIRVHLAELSPAEFPRVLKAAEAMVGGADADSTREFGIELLVAGVEFLLGHRKARKKRKKK